MDWIDAATTATGLKLKTVIAGAMGSFISLRFFDGLKLWERWTTFFGGWAIASYCAEGVSYFLGVVQPTLETGIALGIGLFGMAISAAIMKLIKDTDWKEVVKTILTFRWGGGGK